MTLSDWLSDLEKRHPTEIELGLDRVRLVFDRLDLAGKMPFSIIVAGTNGKGSTLQGIANGLSALDLRVGTYTSPHLYRFNERVCLGGKAVDDDVLVSAFECVERARKDVSLTYFEFTTLAAFLIFRQAFEAGQLDAIVCEVGLGGRLDAVNILDGNLSIVTSIGLDHQDWLGDTVEEIAREKSGVFRTSKPALVGESFPGSVLDDLRNQGFSIEVFGERFGRYSDLDETYAFHSRSGVVFLDPCLANSLPKNNLCLAMQACIIALESNELWPNDFASLSVCAEAIAKTCVAGRLEYVADDPVTLFDVAHNEPAAAFLASRLSERHANMTINAVFSCLKDKDIRAIVHCMAPVVSEWFVAPLYGARAMPVDSIRKELERVGATVRCFDDLKDAYTEASSKAREEGALVLAFGSFYVLEAIGERTRNK